ncbi:hypothetical protein GF373_14360 [bacterium]|nr:hypothetical protein [bacterium]
MSNPSCFKWYPQRDENPPDAVYDRVVIAGALESAYDTDPWIARLMEQIQHWAKQEIPMLGICFGHQLIAQALGGRVEKNPLGWELGSCKISLTQEGREDYLFKTCPPTFYGMQSHQDAVMELPPKAELLAQGPGCDIQAFRLGARIRGIQFHPEFSVAAMREILLFFRGIFEENRLDIDRILTNLAPCHVSVKTLQNFGLG